MQLFYVLSFPLRYLKTVQSSRNAIKNVTVDRHVLVGLLVTNVVVHDYHLVTDLALGRNVSGKFVDLIYLRNLGGVNKSHIMGIKMCAAKSSLIVLDEATLLTDG